MAEIKITVIQSTEGGPTIPTQLNVYLAEKKWPGGGAVNVLVMSFGADTIEVWPADAVRIRELALKMAEIADQIEGKPGKSTIVEVVPVMPVKT